MTIANIIGLAAFIAVVAFVAYVCIAERRQ